MAAAIAAGLGAELPAADLVTIPVADGGDGTVDAAVAAGLERRDPADHGGDRSMNAADLRRTQS